MKPAAVEIVEELLASVARLRDQLRAEDPRRPYPTILLARIICDCSSATDLLGQHAAALRAVLADPPVEPAGRGKR
jgi:hypothetical protein